MRDTWTDRRPGTTRRALLGGTAACALGATSGCVQRARTLSNRRSPQQLSLSIKTVPADADEAATRTARLLESNLDAAGIDAELTLLSEDEFHRDILVNQDFDLYVHRFDDRANPDFLHPFLHSSFAGEAGWQNPFGFTDLTVDELLDEQRSRSGASRRRTVDDLLRSVAQLQPFTTVCLRDEVRAVRSTEFAGWSTHSLSSPLSYLALRRRQIDPVGPGDEDPTDGSSEEPVQLRVTTTDERVTYSLNPLAVEFRNLGTFTGLLYDPLGRRFDGSMQPWLAESWSWDDTNGPGESVTVTLRPDLAWHDGWQLTAEDVAFTYRFLADTSLGSGERPIPAPRFRGRISMIDTVDAVDDRTVRLTFADTSREVAISTLSIPILPIHEWESMAGEADIVGLDLFDGVTEALVWANPEPVGSGPLQFGRRVVDEQLSLRRFDEHFLNDGRSDRLAEQFGDGVAFDELVVRVVPSDHAAVELIAVGESHATASSATPDIVPRVGREPAVNLLVRPSRTFYHVGYNARREPLGNPHFRRAIAGLVDKGYVADGILDGYAAPASSPLFGTGWLPNDLRWTGDDPEVPFLGSRETVDPAVARDVFREAGYQYDGEGRLVVR